MSKRRLSPRAVLLLLVLAAASCGSQESPSYQRGYSGGRECSDAGIGYTQCVSLCEAAAEADGLRADAAQDYVSGCRDGYRGD